jgi:signal transduction histidine kinase
VVALAGGLLVPAVLFDVAIRWTGRRDARRRAAGGGLYLVSAVAAGLHLLAYEPFYDPRCRLTCVLIPPPWDLSPAGAERASEVAAALGVAVCVVAVALLAVVAGRSGSSVWWSSSAVLAAAVLAEGAVAVATAAAVWAPVDAPGAWSTAFLGRAATTLALGSAMTASGVQSRRATRAVERLGERLADPTALAALTGRALRDPDLRVDYWYPDGRRWVDAIGSTAADVEPGRAVTTLARSGDVMARLVHGSRRPPVSADLGRSIGATTLLGIDNARLAAVARARVAEIRASRQRIVNGGDAERRRLERDLHDGAQQRLVSVALLLRMAGAEDGRSPATVRLAAAERQALDIVGELRQIAHGIFPAALAEEGLAAAVLVRAEVAAVPVTIEHVEEGRYDPAVEMAAYAVIDQVLVRAETSGDPRVVRLVVLADALSLQVDMTGSCGALGLAPQTAFLDVTDRLGALGGTLTLTDEGGEDFRVCAIIPLMEVATAGG